MFNLYRFERVGDTNWYEVGISFYLTGDKKYVNDYREIKGYPEAKHYVYSEMIEVMVTNLERFLTESEFKLETFAVESSLDRCKKGLAWMSENKNNVIDIVKSMVAISPYLLTLASSVPPAKYGDAMMQVCMLKKFSEEQKERMRSKK